MTPAEGYRAKPHIPLPGPLKGSGGDRRPLREWSRAVGEGGAMRWAASRERGPSRGQDRQRNLREK